MFYLDLVYSQKTLTVTNFFEVHFLKLPVGLLIYYRAAVF